MQFKPGDKVSSCVKNLTYEEIREMRIFTCQEAGIQHVGSCYEPYTILAIDSSIINIETTPIKALGPEDSRNGGGWNIRYFRPWQEQPKPITNFNRLRFL